MGKQRNKDVNYNYSIGEIIEDVNAGKLKILKQIRIVNTQSVKAYEYECLICGNNDRISEYNLNNKRGCNVCCTPSKKVLKGYNDLWTIHPEVAKLLKYQERGFEISFGTAQKETFVCSNCGFEKTLRVDSVVNFGLSCPRCSDGISYPQKFMTNLLTQLKIEFNTEYVFEWSKNIVYGNEKLNGTKKYDFFIPSLNCIIETHGGQHSCKNNFNTLGGKTFYEEQENDKLKSNLAKENKIEFYIEIDCKTSDLTFIKNNIINSELVRLYDLNDIDWLKCHEYACNSLVRKACDLWNGGIKSTVKIGLELKVGRLAISRYLKQGKQLGWCDYDSKKSHKFHVTKIAGKNKRKIVQLTLNGDFIKKWESIKDAENELELSHLSCVCRNKRKYAGGYKWMYKEDYEKYIKQTI